MATTAPMAYWSTAGRSGDPATQLGWGMGITAVAVIVIIAVLLLAGLLRRRAVASAPTDLAVHDDSGGMPWIYVGVGISTVVLLGFVVWTLTTIGAVAMPARPALTLTIHGVQWWWWVRYEDPDSARVFTTANEIHIPVGRPVRLVMTGDDVIHSFWVPRLAGKSDVIPGQTTVAWIEADQPGRYRGQCGEYCGEQHAHMAMWVVAEPPEAYARWADAQRADAAAPTDPVALQGRQSFDAHCAACHTVRGTAAGGIVGPDLTHIMSRQTIAAGLLPNTPANLSAWIANAPSLKPGTRMPATMLSGPELQAIRDYLETLR
ncbi:MAG TPA: cytochrome c oxidase subunit II [Caldimonas sp.]|nr:cytochrome c oxidase subunit II [Caldimonas sp.]